MAQHEAQDLTQAFFARLLEKDWLRAALPERGRFRSFLLMALKRFLAKEWRRDAARKRGGGPEQGHRESIIDRQLANPVSTPRWMGELAVRASRAGSHGRK